MNSSLHEQLRCALQKNKIPENLGFSDLQIIQIN
jgi:hypothetical protein